MARRTLPALLICALLGLGLPVPAAAAAEVHPEWGYVKASNGVLKKGCKRYPFRYEVTPPEGFWSVEIFLRSPRGKQVTTVYLVYGDPLADTRSFKLCKSTIRPGRFTITAFVSSENGAEYVEGWLPPDHFRLKRPKK